jgi:hypothetical protein
MGEIEMMTFYQKKSKAQTLGGLVGGGIIAATTALAIASIPATAIAAGIVSAVLVGGAVTGGLGTLAAIGAGIVGAGVGLGLGFSTIAPAIGFTGLMTGAVVGGVVAGVIKLGGFIAEKVFGIKRKPSKSSIVITSAPDTPATSDFKASSAKADFDAAATTQAARVGNDNRPTVQPKPAQPKPAA